MKRIKKVFSNHEQVIHLWANQTQDEARCKNVFFEGKSVWSYGRHYELGRLMEYKGKVVAVINNAGYSATTNKHIYSAWHAVEHLTRVKSFNFNVFDGLIEEQNRLIDDMMRTLDRKAFYFKTFKSDNEYLIREVKEFNKTCLVLGHKELILEIPTDLISVFNDHISKCKHREAINSSPEAIAAKNAKKLKLLADKIEAWRNGGQLISEIRNLNPMILRIVNNDTVQTSRGAEVPLSDARRLFGLINARIARKGTKVGAFRFNVMQDSLVKIDCHTIDMAEAKKVLSNK